MVVLVLAVVLSVFLLVLWVFGKKWQFILCTLLMLVLLVFQYQTTRLTDYRRLTEMEKIAQRRRMNEYPPSLYRLANWIEARPESIVYFKLENNFLANFDLLRLFTEFVNPIFLPFFLIGIFEALKTRPKQVLILTLLPIVWLTIIGRDNPNGPLPLFLLIYVFASYGIFRLVSSKC